MRARAVLISTTLATFLTSLVGVSAQASTNLKSQWRDREISVDGVLEEWEGRQTRLKKARAIDPANDPKFAERLASRAERSLARKARIAEKTAAKLAGKTRKAEELAAEKIRLVEEAAAEVKRLEVETAEKERREIELVVERKAARDAKYAARKARQGRKR